MNALVDVAEATLRRSPAPALRLGELLSLVRAETGTPGLPEARLRTVLETHPDRFRLLDPWRGPWRFVRGPSRAEPAPEPWVVLVADPGDQGGPDEASEPRTVRRLRSSVRWLGRNLGEEGGSSLTRWHALVVAERKARAWFRNAA